MELLHLPIEVLRLLLQQTVLTTGLCKGIKLRLVCKLFDAAIPDAISSARLLELYPNWPSSLSTPFVARYLFDRTMADHTNNSNFSSIIHHTVRRLMLDEHFDGEENKEVCRNHYTRTLCYHAAWESNKPYRYQWTLIDYLAPGFFLRGQKNQDLDNITRQYLAAAILIGKNDVVARLLSDGKIDTSGQTYFGRYLNCAAKSGNNEVLLRLLSTSDLEVSKDSYFRPFFLAASAGHLCTVRLLLSLEYNIDSRNPTYKDAIEGAAENGHTDVVRYLMGLSTVEAPEKEQIKHNVLSIACYYNKPEVVLWALDNGADINRRVRYMRNATPLSWTASKGHNDMIRLLLSRGASQHPPNQRPHLPLESAVNAGYSSTVMLLIDDWISGNDGGSYPAFFNEDKHSEHWVRPLFGKAAEYGHAHIVQLFVDLGFDLTRYSHAGHNALERASMNGYLSIIRMLVEMGVDVNCEGSNPVVVAEEYGRDDAVALLVQLGARNTVERLKDGSKASKGATLSDNSRIRIYNRDDLIADYKKW